MINIQILHSLVYIKYENLKKQKYIFFKCCKWILWIQASQYAMYSIKKKEYSFWDFVNLFINVIK